MSLDSWIGSLVSLDCGDTLGTYQGQVCAADSSTQTLTINNAFRNGIACKVPTITLKASDIANLQILKSKEEAKTLPVLKTSSLKAEVITPTKAAKRSTPNKNQLNPSEPSHRKSPAQRKSPKQHGVRNGSATPPRVHSLHNLQSMENGYHLTNGHHTESPKQFSDDIPFRKRTNSVGDSREQYRKRGQGTSTPRKNGVPQENGHGRGQRRSKDDCFSAPMKSFMDDFDFEKNLALFDKQAVFDEIEEQGYPKIVRAVNPNHHPAKYRHDENVLQSEAPTYRQIIVPCTNSKEYVTDSGLVVPTITYEVRSRLFEIADSKGFTATRRLDLIGRSTSEMVLQLIGGSHRMAPRNAHQKPSVVVLCGPHMQGAQGVNCARQLAMHGVNVTLFVPNFMKVLDELKSELDLFELTEGKKTAFAKELPDKPVDMIVSALDSHENKVLSSQAWYSSVVGWANQNKAPSLALDPPVSGAAVDCKWSLSVALPLNLSKRCGQVYLCDVAIPSKVWRECGIKYTSPFGHKFCIALHPNV